MLLLFRLNFNIKSKNHTVLVSYDTILSYECDIHTAVLLIELLCISVLVQQYIVWEGRWRVIVRVTRTDYKQYCTYSTVYMADG